MAGMFDDLLSYLMGGTQMGNFLGVGSPTASTQTPTIVPSSGSRPPLALGSPMLGGTPAPAGGGGLLSGLLGGQQPAGGPPQMHQGLLGDSPLGNMLAGAFAGAGSVQPGQTGLAALGAGAQGAMTADQQRRQEQMKNWYMQQTMQQANQKTQAAQQQRDYLANAAPPPGVDPAQWKTYVQADPEGALAVLGKTMAPDKPTHSGAYNEYQDAVASSGYKGSFIDYQNEDANRKRSISHTTNVTNMPKTLTERVWSTLTDPNADPGSAQYALAYQEATKPIPIQTGTDANGAPTFTYRTPELPPMIRRPTYMGGGGGGGGTAAGDGTTPPPVTSSEVSGGPAVPSAASGTTAAPPATAAGGQTIQTVSTGPAKEKPPAPLTQDEQKTRQLYQHSAQQMPDIIKNYDELAKTANVASSKIGGTLGTATMSTPALLAYNGLLDFAASYLYVTSGATANPGEVQNLLQTIMPTFNDPPEDIAAKKARMQDMLAQMRGRAGLPAEGGQGGNDPLGIR